MAIRENPRPQCTFPFIRQLEGETIANSEEADMSSKPLTRCEFDSGNLLVKLEETLPGDAHAIAPVVHNIMRIINGMGCAAGREFEIELALTEALANAIEHGSANDPSKPVQCCVACDHERGMLIIVRDPGPGFDPGAIPSPIVGKNIFATGGRGIYLINQLMDEVRFEKGGTEIHMRLNPPGKKSE
jgi:serine/threonine-protein kinase RsbW